MDLIVFGTVYLEMVFGDLPALPGPGQEIYTDQFAFSIGGAAVTAATAASRLGVRAGMSALLGDDLGSRVAEQHCRRAGVDMTACRYVTGPVTGVSVAVNFDGDRAFISHLPPRPAGERRNTRRWLEVLREHRPRWCYVHAGPGVAPFARQARSLGVHVALAVAHNDIDDDAAAVVDGVREADIFLANEPELIQLTAAAFTKSGFSAVNTIDPDRQPAAQQHHEKAQDLIPDIAAIPSRAPGPFSATSSGSKIPLAVKSSNIRDVIWNRVCVTLVRFFAIAVAISPGK